MSDIRLFYLEGCPYCRKALAALAELKNDPAYAAVKVDMVEENEQPQVAEKYDYYHVPALFADGEKVYECSPGDGEDAIRAGVKAALDRGLGR
ncbi:MAG: glutathione S-transferase N-terminal domain-containing protein [Lachnospiraceae bacterium]|nr:glutathione S-transferase N-terminal domain-containing protein [Lachnospiraceae bacterium]